jgi:branched-chain amino acid transport system substrate-binding protein
MDMVKHRSWSGVRLLIAVLLVGLAVLPAVTRVAAQDNTTATVGVAFTLTGNAAVYGQSQQKGAELAAEEINASGYIPGVTLKLDIQDDGGAPETGVPVFQKFINDSNTVAIIGPTLSNVAKTTDPLAQDAKMPVLAVSNTADGITTIGDYIFRDSLSEAQVIPNTIAVSKAQLGYTKVAIMYANDDAFSKSGYDVFKQALADNGVEVVDEQTFATNDQEFRSQLTEIKGKNPDAIVVSALAAPATQILIQARQLGIAQPIIGGNGFNSPAIISGAGEAAEGVVVGAAWNIASQEELNQQFVTAFQAKYNAAPDQFAAQAYTGVYVMAEAIKQAGSTTDRTKVRDALAGIKGFPTVLGSFSFTDGRDADHTPVVQIVKDGKFEVLAAPASSATPSA